MEKYIIDLSIIIPVYNTPIKYLKECLESIKNAKIKYSYEIIIVNDGSTNDELISFINSYEEEHSIIIHKENGGLSSARNSALKIVKGQFIICLDSDDLLLPEINTAISFLKNHPKYDIIYSDVKVFGKSNYKSIKGNFSKFKLLYITHITSASNLFRSKVLEKVPIFNENLIYAEDWDFWARAASAGFQFKYLPKPFFKYRKMGDGHSISQKNYEKREDIRKFIKSQFDPHREITLEEVNKYVLNNFKDNKKHLLKLLILLFTPPLIFNTLQKFKIFKNNIVID